MLLFLLQARHIGNEKEGCFVIALSVPIIFSTGCWWSARFIKKDLDTASFTSGVSDTFMVNRFGNSSSSSFLKLLLFLFFCYSKENDTIHIHYVCLFSVSQGFLPMLVLVMDLYVYVKYKHNLLFAFPFPLANFPPPPCCKKQDRIPE